MRASLSAIAVLSLIATPAVAADIADMRPPPDQPPQSQESPLRFEAGLRYWLSWGRQEAGFAVPNLGDVTLNSDDTTHIVEAYGRVDDLYTSTFLKGQAGIGLATTGTYDIAPAGSGSIGTGSRIGYAGIDYGWMPLGQMDGPAALGGFVGYTYWKDAPDIGTGQVAATFGPGGAPTSFSAAQDDFDIHALRIGLRGTADMGAFDIQGEVAAVPYAHVSGALGGSSPNGFVFPALPGVPVYENQQTKLSGWGYGVMTEAMLGFHPTDNLTVRVGGRAWYLQGKLDAVFNGTAGGTNQPSMDLTSTFASIFRYGALVEVSGRF
ncbi:hypothetical protein IC608_07355 [Devosia sp. PTR5]|uniref:Outer membrane protein beta-barrel domain-containing protein n=1 Tax=Devosia oryzisoli TaxID=2774138 RepID=A0A927FWH2_9HYPH|nr:hypothetical protein [Devosia oryzisoli]MBD8065286.1 hypothetical protein [Devosia oryzisoli]